MMHTRHLCCILLMAICSMVLSCHASSLYSHPDNPYAITHIQDAYGANYDFGWDANGNLVNSHTHATHSNRRLCWTEDKRLQAFIERGDEGGIAAWYNYSADGERNIKFTSPRLNIQQNATLFNNPPLVYPTLYASSLITLTPKGYTKHYFEGERRICSAVGGGFSLVEWDTTAGFSSKMDRTECHALLQQLEEGVSSAMRCVDVETSYVDAEGIMRMLQEQHQKTHDDPDVVFFYHLDHLGGTSYLTDKGGQVAQTLAYLPYGENWVDVTAFQYDTSQVGFYQFNGKERDPETGFLYYGARYYWPELWTGWTTPDPMMDKYPGISPYAYCAWNPVNLLDPDGMKIDSSTVSEKIWNIVNPSHCSYNANFAEVFNQLANDHTTLFIFEEWGTPKTKGNSKIFGSFSLIESRMGEMDKAVIGFFWGAESLDLAPERTLFEEIYHAKQFLDGEFGFGRSWSGGLWNLIGFDMYDEESAHKWADEASKSSSSWSNDAVSYYRDIRRLPESRRNTTEHHMKYDGIIRTEPPAYDAHGVYKDGAYRTMRKPK